MTYDLQPYINEPLDKNETQLRCRSFTFLWENQSLMSRWIFQADVWCLVLDVVADGPPWFSHSRVMCNRNCTGPPQNLITILKKNTFICMWRKENCSKMDPDKTNWGARFTTHTASGCGARANSCCAAIFMFTMSYNHSLSIIRDVAISLSVCQESQNLPARTGTMLTIYFVCVNIYPNGVNNRLWITMFSI